MSEKIFLYGAGKRCKELCKILQHSEYEIIAIIDSSTTKWGELIDGYRVEAPDKIPLLKDFRVCITPYETSIKRAIRSMLWKEYQYDLRREVSYNQLIIEGYKGKEVIRKAIQKQAVRINREERILFDCYNGLALGGVQAWTMDICTALIKKGYDNVYIITDQGNYDIPHLLSKHINKAKINHEESFSEDSILNLMEIMLSALPCKVITCTTNEVMLAAYLVKRSYPSLMDIISVIHNSNENVYENYMDFRECSDFYIGVSQDIVEEMITRGVDAKRVGNMTCPFSCEKTLKRTYTEDATQPICIGYAGRIVYSQKRMDLLVKCVELLVERNVNFRLEIAGEGKDCREIKNYISNRHFEEKVIFLGKLKRDDMPSFWKKQDICVSFSDFEGRCISIIEAMGNGVVPIVTATSGVKEDIENGVNGYIVPIGDYKVIAELIEQLSKHREKLKDMGKRAHEMVYPKSRMDKHLEFWENILRV